MRKVVGRFAARALVRWSPAVILTAMAQSALAIPITYQFSTSATPFGSNAAVNGALDGFSVTGTFVYDNEAPLLLTRPDGAGVYASISSLMGSIAGNSFSDPTGIAIVNNDGYTPPLTPPPDPVDFLQLVVNGPGSALLDFSGFDIEGFSLVNVRMFWIEDYTPPGTPDFLSGNAAPLLLPSIAGRLAFDFAVDGEPVSFQNSVFFDGLTVSPVSVPEPATLALLGIGLLGFAATRRRTARSKEL